jgi:uncharacterized protein (TIGR00369 family)
MIADTPETARGQWVRDFIDAMPAAHFLGLQLDSLDIGSAVFTQDIRPEITFDGRQVQGGILGAIADFAGATAALTLLAPGSRVATLDYTMKIVNPALGGRLVAIARVVGSGRTVTTSSVDVFSEGGGRRELVATALVTARNFTRVAGI